MTPKQLYFIQEVGFQLADLHADRPEYLKVLDLLDKEASYKLTKTDESALSYSVEALKIDRWYLL